jgi:hypothetical protein
MKHLDKIPYLYRMKNVLYFLAPLIVVTLISACKENPAKTLLPGSWRGVEWLLETGNPTHNAESARFVFREDGTYTYSYNDLTEQGKWYLVGNELYTTPDGGVKIMVKIPKITADSLVFDMNRGGMREQLTLVRE